MKKYSLFIISLMLMGFQLFGKTWQMTYDSHGLIADEINNMKLTNYIDPGMAGFNQVWDFSELKVNKDFQGSIEKSVYSENYNKLLATNVVLKEFTNEFYFKGDKKSLELYGIASNGNLIMKYDKPFVKMRYPFEYGDGFSGNYYGEYTSGSVDGSVDGAYNVEADGYGSVLLPNNVKIDNVLRVTTTRTYTQKFKTTSSEVKHTTTRFYVSHYRFPLVVMIKTEYKNSTSYQAAYNSEIQNLLLPTAVSESSVQANCRLYPNPVVDLLNIEYTLDKETKMIIEVFNMVGEKVLTIADQTQNAGFFNIPVSLKANNISSGTYYIKINDKTEKVVVQ